MPDIDRIMDMLDWNNPPEVQEEGRRLSRGIRCINVFLQPSHSGHSKNVWDNCATILAERTDQELNPYLDRLFEWLMDMNWPGAFCILDRLKKYGDMDSFPFALNNCIAEAEALKEETWLYTLRELRYLMFPSKETAASYLFSLFSDDIETAFFDLRDKERDAPPFAELYKRLTAYLCCCQGAKRNAN